MPRNNHLNKKQSKNEKKITTNSTKTTEIQYSATALLEKGLDSLSSMEPELAIKFFLKALSLEPENYNVLDSLAEAYLQVGDCNSALQIFQLTTSKNPSGSYSRWLTIAQLQNGHESLASFSTGVNYIISKLEDLSNLDSKEICKLKKDISKAYVGMAELYLTDLCYDENAEQICEQFISKSFVYDISSLDAKQSLANLRLSQKRLADAAVIIKEVFHHTMQLRAKYNERSIIQDLLVSSGNDEDDEAISNMPTLEFSIQTGKLLVECGSEVPSLVLDAIELLTDLLNDDDEIIEIWYIIGIAAIGLDPPDLESGRYHLERAHEMMIHIQDQCLDDMCEFPFNEELCLVEAHLKMLRNENGCNLPLEASLHILSTSEDQDEEWSTEDDEK